MHTGEIDDMEKTEKLTYVQNTAHLSSRSKPCQWQLVNVGS